MPKRNQVPNTFLTSVTPADRHTEPSGKETHAKLKAPTAPAEAPKKAAKKKPGFVNVTLSLPPDTEEKLVRLWTETRSDFRKAKLSRIAAFGIEWLFEDYRKNGKASRLVQCLQHLDEK